MCPYNTVSYVTTVYIEKTSITIGIDGRAVKITGLICGLKLN